MALLRITTLDRHATSGTSWLHRSSPLAKWLIVAAAVGVAILARSPWPLAAAAGLLLAAAATCRLPLRAMILTALLPLPMVGLIALSRWNGTLALPLTIAGKGVVTCLAGLLVAATTPYPDLLAPATRVLPAPLADSLVLTYRALFILWDRLDKLALAIRARGSFFARPAAGALPWPASGTTIGRRLGVAANGTALALIRGADLSGRMYDVMRLRGYQGRLSPTRPLRVGWRDWRTVALAGAVLACAAGPRLAG